MSLTDAERARVKAYFDAFSDAVVKFKDSDPQKFASTLESVVKAHPLSTFIMDEYRQELARLSDESDELIPDEDYMQPDAPWGMVVYRTCYDDDAAWQRLLSELHGSMASMLSDPPSPAVSRHRMVVMDDAAQFDGASHHAVRAHFQTWARDELKRNWSDERKATSRSIDDEQVARDLQGAGIRYNFCLMVDDICLEAPDHMTSSVIKLIVRDWQAWTEEEVAREKEELAASGREVDGPWEGGHTKGAYEYVGWMYIYVHDYVEFQRLWLDATDWIESYIRPPLMEWIDEFDEAPGFWRQKGSTKSSTKSSETSTGHGNA